MVEQKNIKKGEQINATNIIHETGKYTLPKKLKEKMEISEIKNIKKINLKDIAVMMEKLVLKTTGL